MLTDIEKNVNSFKESLKNKRIKRIILREPKKDSLKVTKKSSKEFYKELNRRNIDNNRLTKRDTFRDISLDFIYKKNLLIRCDGNTLKLTIFDPKKRPLKGQKVPELFTHEIPLKNLKWKHLSGLTRHDESTLRYLYNLVFKEFNKESIKDLSFFKYQQKELLKKPTLGDVMRDSLGYY